MHLYIKHAKYKKLKIKKNKKMVYVNSYCPLINFKGMEKVEETFIFICQTVFGIPINLHPAMRNCELSDSRKMNMNNHVLGNTVYGSQLTLSLCIEWFHQHQETHTSWSRQSF